MATAKYSALFPHVAPRCRELLHILVHGAANLPTIDGRIPQCYVTAQSHTTITGQDNVETINATNYVEGVSPQWNEMIYADISEEKSLSEEIILLIIDEPTGKKLVGYNLLWRWFVPFYQYHLNLQQKIKQTSQTTCLYVSIMNKLSSLSKENIYYFGLETLLNGFDVSITNNQSIYGVARIVPDYKFYKQNYLPDQRSENHGIKFTAIEDPAEQDFVLPEFSFDGYPQLSLASKRSKLPIWKHDFLFSHDIEKDNMFTHHNGALVFEFYPLQNIANSTNWRISGLLGWTAILLDARLLNALSSSSAREGMRTEGLLVNSEGDLTSESSKYLTAEILLRLITERHPTKNLLSPSSNNLPVLPSYYNQGIQQNGTEPVYIQVPVPKKSFLPAIQSSTVPLPVARSPTQAAPPTFVPPHLYQPQLYQPQLHQPPPYDFVQSAPQVPATDFTRYRIPRINPYDLDDIPTEYRAMLATNYPPRRDDDINGWFDYFEREVALYKQAIRRIIQDVVQLRDQHKTLRAANIDLRTKLENFEKKKKVLYEIFEGDKIDKAKIQDIFNRLNAKISAQSLEIKENYARIIGYEKELARRGELRAQYDALVHSTQAREVEIKLLQQRIRKADGLEETVRRQEMVIERLESLINNFIKQKRLGGAFSDIDRSFLSEHAALGLEAQKFQRRVSPGYHTEMINSQRDDLLQQNIAYQQELATLKARLQENSAAWGREKAELLTQINDMEPSSPTPRTRTRKPKPS
ncbi:unnamed protein product [Rotaria sordida]|uniref:C2 domain-containing protein n=1 Tax=Rotaria sordida TaxID=392033 RepID=A0A814MSD4_9BILA|nr:unnamed protein product [Rotaria sordida]CAF3569728.1 unnamed protein product [Rotaria sordida]